MADLTEPNTFIDTAYRLEVEGAELYLEVAGPPDAPAIFYLHSGPGYNSYSFRDLMGDELERYHMVYADQRGAGRSLAEGEALDLGRLAEDVVAILDGLALHRVTLLAHGFGAMIALTLVKQQPERVARLLLVNPWVDMALLALAMQREAAQLSGHEEEALPPTTETPANPQELVEQATSWLGAKQLFDAMEFPKAGSRLRLEHSDAESFVGLAEASAEPTDLNIWSLNVDPTGVELPTVILIGKDDKTCYPEQAERILSAMPNALTSLLDAGHYPWLDDPETFSSLLREVMGMEAQ